MWSKSPVSGAWSSDCLASKVTPESALIVSHLWHPQSIQWSPAALPNDRQRAVCLPRSYWSDWRAGLENNRLVVSWMSPNRPVTRSNRPNLDTHTVITVWAYNSISFREESVVGCNVAEIAQLPRRLIVQSPFFGYWQLRHLRHAVIHGDLQRRRLGGLPWICQGQFDGSYSCCWDWICDIPSTAWSL